MQIWLHFELHTKSNALPCDIVIINFCLSGKDIYLACV